jgi:hypothetical protein
MELLFMLLVGVELANKHHCVWPACISLQNKLFCACPTLLVSGVPRGVWGVQTPIPPKFRSFDKAERNSQFRGKIHQ